MRFIVTFCSTSKSYLFFFKVGNWWNFNHLFVHWHRQQVPIKFLDTLYTINIYLKWKVLKGTLECKKRKFWGTCWAVISRHVYVLRDNQDFFIYHVDQWIGNIFNVLWRKLYSISYQKYFQFIVLGPVFQSRKGLQ